MLSGRVVAHPAERRELAQALLAWAAAARRHADLLAANVYEDLEASAVFGVVAEWRTAAGLDAHLRSDAFGVLTGALNILAEPHSLTVTRHDDGLSGEIGAIGRLQADQKGDA